MRGAPYQPGAQAPACDATTTRRLRRRPALALRAGKGRGFCIEEALVVLGVLTLAVALGVPAVARSRRAAAAVGCENNLKQLALATHNHADRTGAFPPGATPPTAPLAGAVPLGWQASLLAEFDQTQLATTADFDAGFDAPRNKPLRDVVVTSLTCPADAAGDWGSYAGVRHHTGPPPALGGSGLLGVGRAIPPRAAYDGLSHTLLCGEKRSDPGRYGFGVKTGWAAGDAGTLRTGRFPPGPHPGKANVDGFWGHHDLGGPGGEGCLFAVGDGAVRWVQHAVDATAFRRLCHRADGGLQPQWVPVR